MHRETYVSIKVWDLPIRLVHWAIVALFIFQLATGQIGGDLMPWHAYSGYAMLVLIIFRILWGFRRQHPRAFRKLHHRPGGHAALRAAASSHIRRCPRWATTRSAAGW
jgi:cytochrome b